MSEQREMQEVTELQKAMRTVDFEGMAEQLQGGALRFGTVNAADVPQTVVKLPENEASDDKTDWFSVLEDDKIQPTGPGMALREQGKVPYHLNPPEFSLLTALVLEYGAIKYAARNFEKGLPPEDLLRGAESHLMAIKAGELNDPESKLPHAAHAAWNLLTFAMQIMRQPVIGHTFVHAMHKTRSGNATAIIQQLGKQYEIAAFEKPDLPAESWADSVRRVRNPE